MTRTTVALRLARGASIIVAAAGLTALGLAPAAAHVTATSTSTAAEGYTRITFSVPNESETASTDRIELRLPAETPFASVRVQPVEGWTAEVTEEQLPEPVEVGAGAITDAPATITWTADAEHTIDPGEFQTFSISAGPLPEEGTEILLPVTQSYTDGRSVSWDDAPVPGEGEAEHPAPSLTTTAVGGEHGAAEPAGGSAPAQTAAASTSPGSAVAWAGLVAGLLGLVAGVVALARTGRRN